MNEPHRRLQQLIRPGDLLEQRYRIGQRVGAGAYGMIFSAVDELTSERVAIKAIPPADSPASETAIGRFQREMTVVRTLVHSNIISLYDWGRSGQGLIFMVLEYVEGETLDKVVHHNPMRAEVAIDVIRQIAMALQVAHEHGVIHRDLKPANVMLSPTRYGGYKVKVLDFGMAKVLSKLEDESIVDLTREGIAVGTPRYIAPEQARGLPVGPAADMYALGLLFYEMLAGEQAVRAASVDDAISAHVSRKPLELPQLAAIDSRLHGLLRALLEKDPDQRLPGASELLQALDRIERGQDASSPVAISEVRGPAMGEQVDILASVDPDTFRRKRSAREVVGGLLGAGEKLELDYDAYKEHHRADSDPVMRRRRLRLDRWFRPPRSIGEWAEVCLSLVVVPMAFLMIGAQASEFGYGLRLMTAASPAVLALVWSLVSTSTDWSNSLGRVAWQLALGAAVVAHLFGPVELAGEMARDPVWFVQAADPAGPLRVMGAGAAWFSQHWSALVLTVMQALPL
ncbi:hypothetical protein DL240_04330 [Lujinxingia litoralis]|uniref:Protein kinase domain-containing protein n=1 Tax=Lujinxingia litoralis TaxID=2211119 RepID=A0A328CC20_9DELT|nr:serine/threonine-protein kinase [Lujinxingia litoralis]RAL25444.1 hypothetical protein DL240_04330 [Lujinxingia litoralis]